LSNSPASSLITVTQGTIRQTHMDTGAKVCQRVRRGAEPKHGKLATGQATPPGPIQGVVAELLGLFVNDGWLAAGILV